MLLIQAAGVVLVAGFTLAGLMWAMPHVRRFRTLRRFRTQLDQAELVLIIWEQSVGTEERAREREPEIRRPRRYDNPA